MLCHSVRSCHWPSLSLKRSFVAIENLATGMPPCVYFTSGSFPRFPIRMTLLTLFPAMSAAPSARGRDASTDKQISGWTPNISEIARLLMGRAERVSEAGQNETVQNRVRCDFVHDRRLSWSLGWMKIAPLTV